MLRFDKDDLAPPAVHAGGCDGDQVQSAGSPVRIRILVMTGAGIQSVKVVPAGDSTDGIDLELTFDSEQQIMSIAARKLAAAPTPSDAARTPETPASQPTHLHTVRELCDQYRLERGPRQKPTTRKSVAALLEHFCKSFGDSPIGDLTDATMLRWVESHSTWTSPKTPVARIVAAFAWAARRGLIPANPIGKVINQLESKSHRRPDMSRDEFQRLLRAAGGHRGRHMRRFLIVMISTGCRPSELAKIERRHVDVEHRCLTLPEGEHKTGGKTGEPRVIPLQRLPLRLIAWLLKTMKPEQTYLLVNERGRPWLDGDGKCTLSMKLRRLRRAAGIRGNVTLYSLRHTFCSELAPHVEPQVLMTIAGHTSIATTMRYYHADPVELADALDAAAEKRRKKRKRRSPSRDMPGQRKMFE